MSMIVPPTQHHSLPLLALKAQLVREWHHWRNMPTVRFRLLMLPIILLFVVSPLLPIAAYALQLWASSSWAWRDRWASIWVWAKQGGAFVVLVLAIAILSTAQVGVFPQLTATLQAFWHTRLGGDLSLSPIDLDSFIARTLLLLPLGPAVALVYERLDPRTPVQLRRILTPADLEPKTETKASANTAPTPPQASVKSQPVPKTAAKPPRKRKGTGVPEQITIDGFLTSDKVQARPVPPSHQATKKQPVPSTETQPPAAKSIDWNDVAE